MQLPIIGPAPIVTAHATVFRPLFENKNQFRHFENYLTGLMVLANKSMANISRCCLHSADKTNLSRFFSEAPWAEEAVNDLRIHYMVEQTAAHRLDAENSCLVIDDTLCEHVGTLFEYVDRHYNHGDNSYPLAHNIVTSHFVSGAVRFPIDLRQYRRLEEMTHWEQTVMSHFPERFWSKPFPKRNKDRELLHKEVDPLLLERDLEFRQRYEQFKTKITLAKELVQAAVERDLPFKTVLFDGWYLSEEFVEFLHEHKKDWISLLKKNRNLETASFVLLSENKEPIIMKGPHISVQDLAPLIPKSAYRKVTVDGRDYWCFTRKVRVPGLGKVRLVISYDNPEITGSFCALVSNRLDWTAQKIIEKYLQRWPIETFYQDSKSNLALDEYRMRDAEAIAKHWCLVFVAYSLLHLECLKPSPEQGQMKSEKPCKTPAGKTHAKTGAKVAPATSSRAHLLPHQSIGQVCRQQAQAVIEALILYACHLLQQGMDTRKLFDQLFARQRSPMLLD